MQMICSVLYLLFLCFETSFRSFGYVGRGSIGESGTAKPSFNFKGVIYVCKEGDKSMSKDEALEKAIEAGAEEVLDGFDDEDRLAYMVIYHNSLTLLPLH